MVVKVFFRERITTGGFLLFVGVAERVVGRIFFVRAQVRGNISQQHLLGKPLLAFVHKRCTNCKPYQRHHHKDGRSKLGNAVCFCCSPHEKRSANYYIHFFAPNHSAKELVKF